MGIQAKLTKSIRSILSHSLLGAVSLEALERSISGDYHPYPTLAERVLTDATTSMNFLPSARAVQTPTYSTPDIFTLNLHGIYFCPEYNILHTEARQIIEESISTQRDLEQFDFKVFYQTPIETIAEVCSLFRSHKNGYYHTLIDNLPRLYLLHHPRYQDINTINLLCSSQPTQVEQFYLDKLLPDNARIKLVEPNKRYLLKNLIFPSFLSRRFSGYLPSEYLAWFIKKVAPQRPRKKVNRIFISRIATHKGRQRCLLNEEELLATLKPYGFKPYVLEHMSIEEQIALFYDAEAVVAAHGAGLANTIFSEQITVLELFPTAFVLPHYYFLSRALGHHYQYWCAQKTGIYDNFYANIPKILMFLDRFSPSSQQQVSE
ncbi:MAG: glycosyltransferase family 61 protein [Cyanobacteria bacterium J06635_15]